MEKCLTFASTFLLGIFFQFHLLLLNFDFILSTFAIQLCVPGHNGPLNHSGN